LLAEGPLAELELWQDARRNVVERWPDLDSDQRRDHTVRTLIDLAVTDVLASSVAHIEAGRPQVRPSPEMERKQAELSRFLSRNLYNHFRVKRMRNKARRFVREMFETLTDDPGQLSPAAKRGVDEHGLQRGVCDYIAGMTDREALLEYRRLFHADAGPTE